MLCSGQSYSMPPITEQRLPCPLVIVTLPLLFRPLGVRNNTIPQEGNSTILQYQTKHDDTMPATVEHRNNMHIATCKRQKRLGAKARETQHAICTATRAISPIAYTRQMRTCSSRIFVNKNMLPTDKDGKTLARLRVDGMPCMS